MKAVLRYRSFELRISVYASDKGFERVLLVAISIHGRLRARGCMTAGMEADLSAGRVEAADYIVGGLEAVRTACAVWARGWEAAVVEATLAAWVDVRQRLWRRHWLVGNRSQGQQSSAKRGGLRLRLWESGTEIVEKNL